MSANARINPDTFYVNGNPIPASYFQALDTAQTAGLDGDAGNGTWAPSSPIQIGGAGMWCCGTWALNPPSSGTVQALFTASNPLTHGDNDYILLASGHSLASRSIHTEMALGKDASGCPTVQAYTGPNGSQAAAIMGATSLMTPSGPAMLALGNCYASTGTLPYRPGGRLQLPLSVHHNATLASVVFLFVISSAHTGQPDMLPQFRVHKVDIFGNLTPLYSGTSTGFVQMAWPGSVAAYLVTNAFTYNCDPGVVIDTTQYSYIAEIIDESGANATSGNTFLSADSFFTNIADMRPQ